MPSYTISPHSQRHKEATDKCMPLPSISLCSKDTRVRGLKAFLRPWKKHPQLRQKVWYNMVRWRWAGEHISDFVAKEDLRKVRNTRKMRKSSPVVLRLEWPLIRLSLPTLRSIVVLEQCNCQHYSGFPFSPQWFAIVEINWHICMWKLSIIMSGLRMDWELAGLEGEKE